MTLQSNEKKASDLTKRVLITLLLIFVLALALRGAIFYKFMDQMNLQYDPRNYHLMSHQLVEKGIFGYWYEGNPFGGSSGVPNARVMPGYPLFLAGVYAIVKDKYLQITVVRLLQVLIGSLSVLMAFAFVKRVFKKNAVAILTALFVAIYPTYVFSTVQLLTEVTALFTLLLYFYLTTIALESGKWVLNMLAGLAFGIHIMIRPALLPLIIVPFLYMLIKKVPLKRVLSLFLMQLAGFVLIMAPWWIRNYVVLGSLILTATASGNPLLAGTYPYFKDNMADVTDAIRGINEKQQALGIQRIIHGFKTEPWLYLKWFTIGKIEYTFAKPYLYNLFGPTQTIHFITHFFIIVAGLLGMVWHAIKELKGLFFYLYGFMILGLQLLFVPDPRFAYFLMFFLMVGAAHLLTYITELISKKKNDKNTSKTNMPA